MIRYSFFGYALSSAIILIICGLAYHLFFSQKMRPKISRAALILILVLGIMGPLIALFFISRTDAIEENIIVGSPMIANVIIEKSSGFSISSIIRPLLPILNFVYIGGILVMTITTLVSIIRLLIIRNKAEIKTIYGLRVYFHDNKFLSSFSWLKGIYIYRGVQTEDLEALTTHERAHVMLYHWVDLLVMQGLLIFQWFNPAVWLMKKELEEVHEYQADNKVLHSGTDRIDYQHLLLRNLSNVRLPGLVAGLKRRSIKKRFIMMYKTDFKSNSVLRGMSICLGVIFAILLLQMPAVADVVEDRELVKKDNVIVLKKGENENLIYHIDNREVSSEEVSNFDSSKIDCVEVFNGEKKVVGIVTKEFNADKNLKGTQKASKLEMLPLKNLISEPTQKLDRMPSYRGGENKLKEELALLIEYRNHKNLTGTVIVGFTVEKSGKLTNFKILKSLDSELDITAVKSVRELSGDWIPGLAGGVPVDVEMKIPVSFSI